MCKKFRLCPLGKIFRPFVLVVAMAFAALQWIALLGPMLKDNIFYNIFIAIASLLISLLFVGSAFILVFGFGYPRYIEVDENKIYYKAKPYVRDGIKVAEKNDFKIYIGGVHRSSTGASEHGVAEGSRNIIVKYAVTNISNFEIHQNVFERMINTAQITFTGTTEIIIDEANEMKISSLEPPEIHKIRGVVLSKDFLRYAKEWQKNAGDGSRL